MTFPCLELKFSQIQRTATETRLRVRLYRVDDGGLDADGRQQFARTLLRDRTLSLSPTVTKVQVLSGARQRLSDWAVKEGYNLTADRLICTL